MSTMTDTEKYTQRVGMHEDGSYMIVRVEIGHTDAHNAQTVEHDPAPGGAVRLSIRGELYAAHTTYGRHDSISGGQNVDDLRAVVKPAPGWSLEEARELADIWGRWHLNDMRAGCAHMELPEDKGYDARKDITCPQTGYKYGSAWLVEELPADVIARVRHLMRDRSHDLYAARGYDAFGKAYPQS